MGGFHFHLNVIQGQGRCGFWILGINLLLLLLSNYGYVSHRLGATIILLQQQSGATGWRQTASPEKMWAERIYWHASTVIVPFDQPGNGEHFCQYDLLGRSRSMVKPSMWNIFDLHDLEMTPWKVIADSEAAAPSSYRFRTTTSPS
jgi:hypothetical protein